MFSTQKVHEALKEPLLINSNPDVDGKSDAVQLDEAFIARLRWTSLAVGFIVGFFVQCSTLGANFVLTILLGPQIDDITGFKRQLIGLAWSFLVGSSVVSIALLLGNLVAFVLIKKLGCPAQQVSETLGYLAFMYFFGDILGIYMAFLATETSLGLYDSVHCLLSLVVVVLWSWAVYRCVEQDRLSTSSTMSEIMIAPDSENITNATIHCHLI